MVERIRKRESLTRPHRRHLYQVLVNEAGISHWKISAIYGLSQLVLGICLIKIKPFGFLAEMAVIVMFLSSFILFSGLVKRKYLLL